MQFREEFFGMTSSKRGPNLYHNLWLLKKPWNFFENGQVGRYFGRPDLFSPGWRPRL